MLFINCDFYIFAFEENRDVNESLTILKRKYDSETVNRIIYC